MQVQRYTSLELIQIKTNPKKAQGTKVAQQAEGEKLLKQLLPQDFVIVLDERGQELSSARFAKLIAQAGDDGAANILFCIGGPYGHTQQVRERANKLIRLSAMVLNHQSKTGHQINAGLLKVIGCPYWPCCCSLGFAVRMLEARKLACAHGLGLEEDLA
ncbi:hypothetical protein WJX84_009706 [Apatococcus fuscideae]|uniref:Uncharacterized protein n=1 Tax=Apatococcus fuscideae TaxID=2026836 RepID=A0AAW1TG74_9CHLO